MKSIEGIKSVVPLDIFLKLDRLPFKMSVGMMLEVAFWAQNQGSYEGAQQTLNKLGHAVNDDTVRHVANHVGGLVHQEDCRRAEESSALLNSGKLHFPGVKKGVLYIETDGAALNTRQKNDEGSTWRENKLGLVFSSDNIRYWRDLHGKLQHKIQKREYVSLVGSVDYFKKLLFSSALRNGYGEYEKTLVISDGATWIRHMVEEYYPDAQQILDFFHLCENVHEYAKALFKDNEKQSKAWAEHICGLLKTSRHQEVLEKLEPYKNEKICHVNLYLYIMNNIKNIDYASYINNGYFIGSGAIESGNKIVLQDRLKRSGQRWNPETAQNILALKAKFESGLWDEDVRQLLHAKYNMPNH